MYEDDFSKRLAELRINKGVSARDMSLSIGQNAGYINSIETKKSLPSMSGFFYICDYLNITPKDFFDFETKEPEAMKSLIHKLKLLDGEQFAAVDFIVSEMMKKKK